MVSARSLGLSVWLVAGAAFATDLGAELSVGGSRATQDSPRSGFYGALLDGAYDFSDRFGVSAALGFTHDNATQNDVQQTQGNNLFLFHVAADLMLGNHWLLSAGVMGSPNQASRSATTLTADDPQTGTVVSQPVVVATVSNAYGALLDLAFGSNGESKWEHTADLTAQLVRFGTNQHLELPNPTAKERLFLSYCSRHPTAKVCTELQPQVTALYQVRVGGGYTATLFSDTDVGLEASYFFYDHDPTQTHFYSATFGVRTVNVGETPSSIAPLQLTLKPFIAHRFGERFSLKAWAQYGQYVPGEGYDTTGGVKAQLKLGAWKLYLIALVQRDVDGTGAVVPMGTVILGASYLFGD